MNVCCEYREYYAACLLLSRQIYGLYLWFCLKADFGDDFMVHGIATQSRRAVSQWVTNFTVSYATKVDGDAFTQYMDDSQVKVNWVFYLTRGGVFHVYILEEGCSMKNLGETNLAPMICVGKNNAAQFVIKAFDPDI